MKQVSDWTNSIMGAAETTTWNYLNILQVGLTSEHKELKDAIGRVLELWQSALGGKK